LVGLPLFFSDRPVARLLKSSVFSEAGYVYWMYASPISLCPDGDGLRLLASGQDLSLTTEESLFLVELFNRHFSPDYRLWFLDSTRWILSFNQYSKIKTQPLVKVNGRRLDHHLPVGDDSLKWHCLINECQMLFSQPEVNQQRQEANLLPVNSLWVWWR